MNATNNEKKIDIFKWAITTMVAIILGISIMITNLLIQVKATQGTQAEAIARITAIQNINTDAIASLNKRVSNIESDRIAEVKQWALETFVQKK